ncbi:MAG: hypothetical protein IPK69_06895 [Phycisphaerales bacterium]|nr:MAG: hypothetical protein IPK69_06895 [Phycisphaerales bacterium]
MPHVWVVIPLFLCWPILLLILFGPPVFSGSKFWWAFVGPSFAILFVPQILLWSVRRRYTISYRQSVGRLCLQCGRSLRGLQDRGQCPECGSDYDIERDRKKWKDANISEEPANRSRLSK